MAESMSVFVTAGTSPVGRAVVRQLVVRGHKVMALTQGKVGADLAHADGAIPVYADPTRAGELRSMMSIVKPNVVINLQPQVPNSLLHDGQDWKGFDKQLKATTAALLEASEAAGVGFIVHTSYAFLYGDTHSPADENSARTVPGNYPAFKAAIEAEDAVSHNAIPSCVLRAGYLYGADDHNLALYADSFRVSRPFFAGGEKKSAWLHHEDMARACVLAAEQQPKGEVFNIADEKPISLAEFINAYAKLVGSGHPGHVPTLVVRMLGHISAEQITLLDQSTIVSTAKAQSQLGWKPQYPSYQQGLDQAMLMIRAAEKVV
jgi:nucleoside-diphosphate-sugar epimerase